MALYTIADLHLSTCAETNKSMEVFGGRWENYVQRLRNNWYNLVGAHDTVVIPGDISWALTLREAQSDFAFLDGLPGHKILLKGNHDFWWLTMKKNRDFCQEAGFSTLDFLHNDAKETDRYILAGSRGWYAEADTSGTLTRADFQKITAREAGRLRTSLHAAMCLKESSPEKEILVFTHFPPVWNGKPTEGIYPVLKEFPVRRVFYGHIHGNYTAPACIRYEQIDFYLVSADYLSFIPQRISD